jgi:hypothetical protein
MTSGESYSVGSTFDAYFGATLPDVYYVGIVNPDNAKHTITAVTFQSAFYQLTLLAGLICLFPLYLI